MESIISCSEQATPALEVDHTTHSLQLGMPRGSFHEPNQFSCLENITDNFSQINQFGGVQKRASLII